jgi:hypothetical protein
MAGFENDVLLCSNVNFNPGLPKPHTGLITQDGQLIIGSTALNAGGTHLNIGTLSAGSGISITNGPGTIIITNTAGGGGGTLTTLGADSGVATPVGGVINILGGTGCGTIAAGMTLTVNVDSTIANLYQADTGSATPSANTLNVLGSGSITTNGSGSTLTTSLTGLTAHAVLVGAGTSTITKVGPTATIGQVLQSAGAAADPAFSTATYPLTTTHNQILYSSSDNVITGLATANRAVLTTGTTGIPVLTTLPADGELLIGSTAGVPAAATLTQGTGVTITNASNSITIAVNGSVVGQTITGDTGGALSPTAGNWNILGSHGINTSGSVSTLTVAINNAISLGDLSAIAANSNALSATTGDINIAAGNAKLPTTNAGLTQGVLTIGNLRMHMYGSDNIFLGNSAGNGTLTGSDLIGIGVSALTATTNATGNICIGPNSGKALTSGSNNCTLGGAALRDCVSSNGNIAIGFNSCLTATSGHNTCVGYQTGNALIGGGSNTLIGYQAGTSYTGSEANNLCLGAGVTGTAAESNTIRIGSSTTACYITGIYGVSVASSLPVTIGSGGQLGTSAGGGNVWVEVTGTSQSAAVGFGYIANNAGLVTITLPANFAVGDVIRVAGLGAGGWTLVANTGDIINFGSSATSAAGSLSSTNRYDAVEVLGAATNTTWVVLSSIGNLTVA